VSPLALYIQAHAAKKTLVKFEPKLHTPNIQRLL
jgi:hypothetical protein